jgi:hypothetical protein
MRIGLLLVVIAALSVALWFTEPAPAPVPAAPASPNVSGQAHAPSHGPKPEEAVVEEEEPAVKEVLPVLEKGVSPSLKHLLLTDAEACAKRVRFWTSKEQLFAADLRLTSGKDGVTASVLRNVAKRPPFERCIDRELRTQPVNDIELTAPAMRTSFSLADVTQVEKRPGELPEPAEVIALLKKCAPGTPLVVRFDAVVGEGAVVIEKPDLQGELAPPARQCLLAGLERHVAFTEESKPGWAGLHQELKVDDKGKATKTVMKFLK